MASESITAKDARFKVICMAPDVCLTPGKNGVPVPYPIVHMMDQSMHCSPNVFIASKPAYLHNQSYVDNVKGDEAGGGKGVVSQTHMKISHDIDYSKSVFINGRAIVRTGDKMWMNWTEPGGGAAGKAGPSTGLGKGMDDLVAKSPTLQQDLEKLQQDGWKIEYGKEGGGSFANQGTKTITLDGNLKNDPTAATRVLSHEVGHATYSYQADFSSRSAYVNGQLADEGAAAMKNIEVQREIIKNGGPDIGIAGNSANHGAYNGAFDQYVKDGNAAAARDSMGKVFGQGEITSTTKQPYADYYGDWYDQNIAGKKK
ncbi:DUF4150 domain-containing protein [Paracidovorax konjaci]|uniref:Uncharacterized protein n=1 Tax=Paracidovorax konjaci TaxID=32040 RepID=A0A1I1VD93_9BURK|nr:protein of unknown function [Paracidovorax konjaci]